MTDPAMTAKVPRWLKLTLWMVAGLCFALAMWLNFAKGLLAAEQGRALSHKEVTRRMARWLDK